MTNSTLIINDQALIHNYHHIRRLAPRAKILAMVKANAYGHGLIYCAKLLAKAGVDALGVACFSEAISLRQAAITIPIVIMRGINSVAELACAQQYQLDIVVHHVTQLLILQQQASLSPFRVWLKINTGMNRLGFTVDEAPTIYQKLIALPLASPLKVFSHFANADNLQHPVNQQQMQSFNMATAIMAAEKSLANSAAILHYPASHLDWVRPGLMLYGVSPIVGKTGKQLGLQPVMDWRAQLISVRRHLQGDFVGYGSTWQFKQAGYLGVVSIGYGDGYPRQAEHDTPLLINGKVVPLIGRVSMDMLTVDLTHLPEAKVGDGVLLWGKALPIEKVAGFTGTNSYELLTRVQVR